MTTHQEAAEQLRVIRTMMERATIFRALSGEAALLGGAMSVAAGWMSEGKTGWAWGGVWLGGLAVVILFAIWQLSRLAHAHARPMWSHGLKVALRGALPSLVRHTATDTVDFTATPEGEPAARPGFAPPHFDYWCYGVGART